MTGNSIAARLGLAGCACVALLLVARPALATPVAPTGQLVWETHTGFVLTNPLGGGASALPPLQASVGPWRVALSPSGKTLMIESFNARTNPPGMNLCLLNLNTGRTRPLAQFPPPLGATPDYLNGMGAFSPDGSALAYGFAAGAASQGAGEGVVFMSVANGHRIRSINIPGGNPVPVFQWLPDGRLMIQDAGGLATVSKTGTGVRPINIRFASGEPQIVTATASPNGSEVAMEVDSGDGCGNDVSPCSSALYLAPLAGGSAIQLARAESGSIPVWSPDGKFLVYDGSTGTPRLMTVATRHTVTIRRLRGWAEIVGWRAA